MHEKMSGCPFHQEPASPLPDSKEKKSTEPLFYYGVWSKSPKLSTEKKSVYHRSTDKGSVLQEVDFSALNCTPRFRFILEVWGDLAFSKSLRAPSHHGMKDLQLLVNELALLQRQPRYSGLQFESFLEVINSHFANADVNFNMNFSGLRLADILVKLKLPIPFFDLVKHSESLADEEFFLFWKLLLTLETRIHKSLHSLVVVISDMIFSDYLPLEDESWNVNLKGSNKFNVLGTDFYAEVWPWLFHPRILPLVNRYINSVSEVVRDLARVNKLVNTHRVILEVTEKMIKEVHTGIVLFRRYDDTLEPISRQDLESHREYSGPKKDSLPNTVSEDIIVTLKKDDNAEIRTFTHKVLGVYLPLTKKIIEVNTLVGACPHPYNVPQAIG